MDNIELAKFFKYNVEGVLKLSMNNVGTVTVSCTTVFALQSMMSSSGTIDYSLPMILVPVNDSKLAIAIYAGKNNNVPYFMAYASEDDEITFTVWQ